MNKDKVIAAAVRWWARHRPVDWTLQDHMDNPTINTATPAEKKLALVVAAHLKAVKEAK
jgi:hypothetical protein